MRKLLLGLHRARTACWFPLLGWSRAFCTGALVAVQQLPLLLLLIRSLLTVIVHSALSLRLANVQLINSVY